jgi:hypothetical protein
MIVVVLTLHTTSIWNWIQRCKVLARKKIRKSSHILAAYKKKAKSWPTLKYGDGRAFRRLLNFLIKCESIYHSEYWNALDTPEMLCTLVAELPGGLIDSWNRKALGIRRKHSRESSLKDFLVLVDDECDLVNGPLFSGEALKDYTGNIEQPQNRRRKVKHKI